LLAQRSSATATRETTPPAGEFKRFDLGANVACGIGMDDALVCWGTGTLLDGIPTGPFIDVAVNELGACAIKSDGHPACWGISSPFFETTFPPAARSIQIEGSSEGDLTCSLLNAGSVFCAEISSAYPSPSNNVGNGEIAVGTDFYCYVASDRTVACQDNSASNSYTPPTGLRVLSR
jgi:hypothetical protein